jgi:tetratricopeptide (TPR) repeat protein
LRAYATLFSPGQEIPQALRLLEEVLGRDPSFGPALACAAMCCSRMIGDGSSKNPAEDRRKGADYARRALAVAGDDAVTLGNAAFALAGFGGDLNSMIAIVDRALTLNPSFARGWYISGFLMLMAGDLDEAIERAETAERLSPRVRGGVGSPSQVIGTALVLSHRFEEAIPRLEDGSNPIQLRWLAASYAHLGRRDKAREVVARLRATGAVVVPEYPLPYRNPEHHELFLSGLRLAMDEAE